ncbi:Golgi membrane exchange factor (Ric1p-Rgp1p) subunit [Mucor circinelloides]
MSNITVTTAFSQGAVFYAGETLSCTISFTNSHQQQPSSLHTNGLVDRHKHARAQSYSSFDLTSNNAKPTLREVESLAITDPPSRKMSLSSLASSTYSYLTGSTAVTTKEPECLPEAKKWEENKDTHQFIQYHDFPDQTIELDDDEDTESIDTQSLYSSSRRSSIDSNASHIPPLSSRRHPNQLYRLSTPACRSSIFLQRNHPEHLLWGFAQVVGQFTSDPKMLNSSKFASLKSKAMYHPFGTSSMRGERGGGGGGGGMLMKKSESSYNKRESQTTMPVFSTPPSILFVDLNLSPGETVTYSYRLKLPKNLPPSYRGKSIRFNYYLVIGSQRSASATRKSVGAQQGHVVQIPFRVFNHVSENGSRPIYDLMTPVINYTDQAIITTLPMKSSSSCLSADGTSARKKSTSTKSTSDDTKCRQEFKEYIDGLLLKTASKTSIDEIMQRQNDLYEHDQDQEDENEEKLHGKSCRQTISRITNTSKRATFDICKNNRRVAQLHLIKTLFRLGEPIQGIIDFEGAVIPTFQISIYLESHEVVDESIASRQPQYIARVSRKRHAGHHTFSRYDKRISFSLAVPTGESPEFQTSAIKLQYYLKIEFVTAAGTSNANEPTFQDKFHQYYHASTQVEASSFDCQIPVHVFGCSHGSYSNSSSTIFGGPHTFALQ